MKKDYSYGIIPIFVNKKWEKEFLIINQKTEHWNFVWFPKWHPETWEDEITTAKRELKEEVGISDVEIDENRFWGFNYKFKEKWIKYDKTVKYRLGYVQSKETKIQEEELNSCEWLSYDDVLKNITHENMKKLFIKMISNIE